MLHFVLTGEHSSDQLPKSPALYLYFQVVVKHNSLKVSEHHLISSLIKLFDCHLNRLIEGSELKGQSETALNPLFEGVFFFSCIWSIGAVCDSRTKKLFDTVFTQLTEGELSEEILASLQLKDSQVP